MLPDSADAQANPVSIKRVLSSPNAKNMYAALFESLWRYMLTNDAMVIPSHPIRKERALVDERIIVIAPVVNANELASNPLFLSYPKEYRDRKIQAIEERMMK